MRARSLLLLAFGLLACGDDDGPARAPDGGDRDDGGPDTGPPIGDDAGPDAGPDTSVPDPCDFSAPGTGTGSACTGGTTCSDPLICRPSDPDATIPSRNLDGTDGPALVGEISPGDGECTITCNLQDPGETCGACATCAELQLGTISFAADVGPAGEPLGVCRPLCTPVVGGNGGCRDGYTCSLISGTCVEACQNDRQCAFGRRDVDGDGADDLAFLGDAYPGRCDTATGRCTTMGSGGSPGDPCTGDGDCEDGGTCLLGAEYPAGYCTRFSCSWPGFECAPDAVCDVRSDDRGLCRQACLVGAEPEADRLGTAGHGMGCSIGLACEWDGTSMASATPNGGCVPGVYGDITVPNVGAPCLADSDCYSPFGYGDCLFEVETRVDSGLCGISNCATFTGAGGAMVDGILPGIETTTRVCDTSVGELCVNFGEPDRPPSTFCLQSCTDAAECAPGFGCAELISGGARLCWPYCTTTGDCRAGSVCEDATGGTCETDTEQCYCSDRTPRT